MLHFKFLPIELQVLIAEKVDYFDQEQLEFSSKHGKTIVKLSKRKAVVEMEQLATYAHYRIADPFYIHRNKLDRRIFWLGFIWKILCGASVLPRFKLSKITISRDVSIELLIKVCNKLEFVRNEVVLEFESVPTEKQLEIFTNISEIFTFSKFTNGIVHSLDSALFLNPRFCEVLKNQWFNKTREIRRFMMYTKEHRRYQENIVPKEKGLLSGFRFSVIWHHDTSPTIRPWLNNYSVLIVKNTEKENNSYYTQLRLFKDDSAYSINRGDRKLLVLCSKGGIIAHEYEGLKCVVYKNVAHYCSVRHGYEPRYRTFKHDYRSFLPEAKNVKGLFPVKDYWYR